MHIYDPRILGKVCIIAISDFDLDDLKLGPPFDDLGRSIRSMMEKTEDKGPFMDGN